MYIFGVELKAITLMTGLLIVISCTSATVHQTQAHPCKRTCDGTPMTCKYHFQVETYYILDAMACYQCPEVESDCYRPDCIVAGGIKRNIMTANRRFPGPPIEVCQDDTVELLVENLLINDEATSIHFHGQPVKDTPYMDGVPFVTQCPILSNNNFTYRLKATAAGTHFWHSHSKFQRGDGLFGMMVVKVDRSKNPHYHLYDEDLTEHQIAITDWTRKSRIERNGEFIHGGSIPTPDGILINGLGYMDFINVDFRLPIAEFTVEKGKRYRFRFVNAEFFACPFMVSFDKHNLTIIASDGDDVKPQNVTHFNIFAGERYDAILEANQEVGTYWMRVKGLNRCEYFELYQIAILKYAGSKSKRPNEPFPTPLTAEPQNGLLLNPLLGDEPDTLLVNQLKSYEPVEKELTRKNVIKKFIKISMNQLEVPESYRPPYYGYQNVSEDLRIHTSVLNDIAFKDPSVPLLQNRDKFSEKDFCTNETAFAQKDCTKEYCHCTHVIELPKNQVVELILFDIATRNAHHPMHLHGYHFRVLAWKRLGNTTSLDEIQRLDRDGKIERNFVDAIKKDTITVPLGGYTVIRFKTDNPGYWLFHCHVDSHAVEGMQLVFKVGKNSDMPKTPKDFPQCGNYDNVEKKKLS